MRWNRLYVLFFVIASGLLFSHACCAQDRDDDGSTEVAMRMIGHQLLINAGDSTSVVLPVKKQGNRYRIEFASEFDFHPSQLKATVDSVMKATQTASAYLVEIQHCGGDEVAHSFQVGVADNPDITPCGQREQPRGCYSLFVTILDAPDLGSPQDQQRASMGWWIGGLLVVFGFIVYWTKRHSSTNRNQHVIAIGGYQFDTRNMELVYDEQKTELTSKESDLLVLLHGAANTTLEREVILQNVWGDKGDYVGRTLDVFISKLRKKLESDPTVKIANIRGIGYRLVLNDTE